MGNENPDIPPNPPPVNTSPRLALINALAGLGDPDFRQLQQNEWQSIAHDPHGDPDARKILQAWARHPESRPDGLVKGLQHPHVEVRCKALELLLDGPLEEAYLPMLRFLEPQLSPGALVVADDLDIAPQALAPYLDYVRKPGSGYVSVELPLGDRIEVSLRA